MRFTYENAQKLANKNETEENFWKTIQTLEICLTLFNSEHSSYWLTCINELLQAVDLVVVEKDGMLRVRRTQ